MKKTYFLIFSFLLTLSSCITSKNAVTESKRIFGNVLVKNPIENISKTDSVIIEKATGFNVYITKSNKSSGHSKLIYKSKDSLFDFIIPSKKLKKYKYLLFENPGHFKYVKIDSIKGELKDLILDYYFHSVLAAKPAIYLYPTIKRKISIIHNFKGQILNTYPEYKKGWKIIASPSGKIQNIADNRIYNYLFWDGTCNFPKEHYNFKTGFVVEKSELVSFLQEKLALIGLNNTEINDFIVYWLPILSKNKYNFIHFRINDNIDNTSFLNVEPKPDTEIRVFMEFKEISNKNKLNKIPEQKLMKIKREGFTLIEWGGAYIGNNKIE